MVGPPEIRRRIALRIGRLVALTRTPPSKRMRILALLVSSLLFFFVVAISITALGGLEFHPIWLVGAALVTPVIQFLNALEYRITGHLVGEDIGFREAFETSTLASAANLLPLPGGTLVRAGAIHVRTSQLQQAIQATVTVGLFWLGGALIVGALSLAIIGEIVGCAVLGSIGVLSIALGIMLRPDRTQQHGQAMLSLLLTELVICGVAGGRIALVMKGIGFPAAPSSALLLAASGPVAGLIGFFPGGLGMQELVAAALAPLASVSRAIGSTSVAVDRLLGYACMAVVVGLYIWLCPGGRSRLAESKPRSVA